VTTLNQPLNANTLQLNPQEMSAKDKYKLIIGCIVPRPIAFVSTKSQSGVSNLAPFSFFNGVASNPPSVVIAATIRSSDGGLKDTLLNIKETGEFVVNVVTEDIVKQVNQSSAEYDREVNEFEQTGLTEGQSVIVKASRVMESPINMECKLTQLVPVGDGGQGSSTLIIGEIVYFHIREDLYDNGRIDIEKLKPVSRLAGSYYAPVREIFDLPRPML